MNTIIFCDIDGVLVDSKEAIYQAYKLAFVNQNFEFTKKLFDKYFWFQSWDINYLQTIFPNIDLEKLRVNKQAIFKNKLKQQYKYNEYKYNDNLHRILTAFTISGTPVILVTSGSKEATELKLRTKKQFWVTIDYVKNKHDTLYWQELKAIFNADHHILIDDDFHACLAAKKVGFITINYK